MSYRIIRLPEVKRRTALGRSTIYLRVATDPAFPRPISLGGRSVGWIETELDAWLQGQAARRQSPPSGEL
jgi:prophage regulatory protein